MSPRGDFLPLGSHNLNLFLLKNRSYPRISIQSHLYLRIFYRSIRDLSASDLPADKLRIFRRLSLQGNRVVGVILPGPVRVVQIRRDGIQDYRSLICRNRSQRHIRQSALQSEMIDQHGNDVFRTVFEERMEILQLLVKGRGLRSGVPAIPAFVGPGFLLSSLV